MPFKARDLVILPHRVGVMRIYTEYKLTCIVFVFRNSRNVPLQLPRWHCW